MTLETSTSSRVKPYLKVYRGANPLACALALICLRHRKSQKCMLMREKSNFSQKTSRKSRKVPSDPGSPNQPYRSTNAFIRDVAAICVVNVPTGILTKKVAKKTTVQGSLEHALSAQQIGYVLNYMRFIARNPDVKMPFGTVVGGKSATSFVYCVI